MCAIVICKLPNTLNLQSICFIVILCLGFLLSNHLMSSPYRPHIHPSITITSTITSITHTHLLLPTTHTSYYPPTLHLSLAPTPTLVYYPQVMPPVVKRKGLSLQWSQYLFEKFREYMYVHDPTKRDNISPRPYEGGSLRLHPQQAG